MKKFLCCAIAVGCLLLVCPESRADEAQDFIIITATSRPLGFSSPTMAQNP